MLFSEFLKWSTHLNHEYWVSTSSHSTNKINVFASRLSGPVGSWLLLVKEFSHLNCMKLDQLGGQGDISNLIKVSPNPGIHIKNFRIWVSRPITKATPFTTRTYFGVCYPFFGFWQIGINLKPYFYKNMWLWSLFNQRNLFRVKAERNVILLLHC